ncbi:CoA-disulfide reductase [Tepidanaerobacter acetatoxydans Re1]|uniref:CoA-disulfide reductase n=1 Tax=Tepidanaerobacter acetatoxydans (strain DSM 21804 / JCM 16047 / Re1) TaxID=1209989 RepID=F4LUJ8_TEPAE|nr:FAD-dependent oxidoreductase [Tepidanaerobacter acetatoxydans]AEE92643.1 CoA-disulfide reductase [Tepidanaerobacter acetatoxydans Re1]CCP27616.1 CoA-disulfide reductase [Tepidanaerobacter acetatoxydans Re1]
MDKHLVVIGGTAAGMSAAARARRGDPSLSITVFERTGHITYGSCGLPYYIGDVIKDVNKLITYTPEYMKKERNIDVYTLHDVTDINTQEKYVKVKDLKSGDIFKQPYTQLVIATGAIPVVPKILGVEHKNIFTLRNVEDGLRIKELLSSGRVKRAAILGAGFIGLEVSEALRNWGIEVTVFEMLPAILPQIDEEFAILVEDELQKNSVKLYKNTKVVEFQASDENVIKILTEDGRTFESDMVIASVGVKPSTALARNANISIGPLDGIAVDKYMRTSAPYVWAAGDCTETYNLVTRKPAYLPLGTTANKQGKIAGENVVGGSAAFPGILGTQVTKIFDTYVASTGLNEMSAKDAGIAAVSAKIVHTDKASYYPGSKYIHTKIVLDKNTAKIIGAQMTGSEGIGKRIDVFATAITAGMTAYQLNELDLAYAPPVSPVYDPVLIAASAGIKELEKA